MTTYWFCCEHALSYFIFLKGDYEMAQEFSIKYGESIYSLVLMVKIFFFCLLQASSHFTNAIVQQQFLQQPLMTCSDLSFPT